MRAEPLPSALLSEGFCPVGHGKLEQQDRAGWCEQCGLGFTIHRADLEDDIGTWISISRGSVRNNYSFTRQLLAFDQFHDLATELIVLREDLEWYDNRWPHAGNRPMMYDVSENPAGT